jgi:alpha-N-acetylglucosamine transferase
LEKLYVFQLTGYDRVIVMDADGFPNNNLDHLFWLTMPIGTYIAGMESPVVLNLAIAKVVA